MLPADWSRRKSEVDVVGWLPDRTDVSKSPSLTLLMPVRRTDSRRGSSLARGMPYLTNSFEWRLVADCDEAEKDSTVRGLFVGWSGCGESPSRYSRNDWTPLS